MVFKGCNIFKRVVHDIYSSFCLSCFGGINNLTDRFSKIIKYPGALTSDNWGQLTQYSEMFPMYSHCPPFHTWLLGTCVYTGYVGVAEKDFLCAGFFTL